MRAFVFTDKGLERYAGQFVWLSVDTENAKNASFLKKYPIPALPTMMIVDPRQEAVSTRYVGGMTLSQLSKFLDDGQRTYRGKATAPADALLASADKLAADGKSAEAAKLYEQALAKGPKNWKSYNRAAESYVLTLSMAGDNAPCAAAAHELYPKLKGTLSGANVASVGLGCALSLEETNADRKRLAEELETATRAALDDPKITMAGDDRSGLYMTLIDARDQAKDEAGSKKLQQEWSAFLDAEAAKAKTAEERTVYDSHRLSAYMSLGTPEKAIPMLEQSERDFPNDYNPPARLAIAYKEMKEYDKALAASDRALARVYGPRKVTVYRARADIYTAKGDKEGAKRTLQEAIAYAKSLPEGQRNERTIASLEKKLNQ